MELIDLDPDWHIVVELEEDGRWLWKVMNRSYGAAKGRAQTREEAHTEARKAIVAFVSEESF